MEVGSEAAWDAWQQDRYKVDTRFCTNICCISWIGMKVSDYPINLIGMEVSDYPINLSGMEVSDYPIFHGIDLVYVFLNKIGRTIRESHKVLLLDIALQAIPTRWWK